MDLDLDKFVFVLGAPGSGKGTLCRAVSYGINSLNSKKVRCEHLSVGDFLRGVAQGTVRTPYLCDEGVNMVRRFLRDGLLLEPDPLVPILRDELVYRASFVNPNKRRTVIWLIDGFPRDAGCMHLFESLVGKPTKVLVLRCEPMTALRRFMRRAREQTDDEDRFVKRYNQHIINMRAIGEHYKDIIETFDAHLDPVSLQLRLLDLIADEFNFSWLKAKKD
ncbi:P-loop containing nucleoside triphosphate hydrolase protein [Xylariaceae sp. FL0594]|nr:P-loop containing nucleoside triphosphate hydrolase protein [Xylariaceae sp. FL0594]